MKTSMEFGFDGGACAQLLLRNHWMFKEDVKAEFLNNISNCDLYGSPCVAGGCQSVSDKCNLLLSSILFNLHQCRQLRIGMFVFCRRCDACQSQNFLALSFRSGLSVEFGMLKRKDRGFKRKQRSRLPWCPCGRTSAYKASLHGFSGWLRWPWYSGVGQ